MCAINPQRTESYIINFYTSHPMADERWKELVVEALLRLEQEFNRTGEIRVHINEAPNVK